MRWRDVLELRMFDMCATALALGYAIGRIGCQVSGDGDYGIHSTLPWAMGYPHGTLPTPPGVKVQPTPIYETVAMCLLAYGLWQIRDRVRPGVVFALYLLLSGLRALPGGVRQAQQGGVRGPDPAAAGERRADAHRRGVAGADGPSRRRGGAARRARLSAPAVRPRERRRRRRTR